MSRREAEELLDRYLAGECTPEEKSAVEYAYSMSAEPGSGEIDYVRLAAIKADLRKNLIRKALSDRYSRRKVLLYAFSGAAAVLLVIVTLFQLQEHSGKLPKNIVPGGNRATLTLADGRVINLSEQKKGIILEEEGRTLYSDGSALEDGETLENYAAAAKPQYAILSTPRGGQYQITLPDGSRVWVNSESKLKYPSKFAPDERRVEIEGEAYFEVEKSDIPFIVFAGNMAEIRVLGTNFNISAYGDETSVKTSLAKGSVKVVPANNAGNLSAMEAAILKPGEQSELTPEGTQVITKINPAIIGAWTQGRFAFYEDNLESILNRLCKWYDLNMEFKDQDLKKLHFTGNLPRYDNLDVILEMLMTVCRQVDFEIQNKTMIVKKR
jgi:ferric-dicitrate binding protein FerR (iron transport regulator)